jgi:hypothetical protein
VVGENGIGGGGSSLKSTNNAGTSWSSSTGFTDDPVCVVWFERIGKFVMFGEAGFGTYTSTDGVAWTQHTSTFRRQRGIGGSNPKQLISVGGGRMLIGSSDGSGSGEYATIRRLSYTFDAVTWYDFDFRNAGPTVISMATDSRSQLAILYSDLTLRLFGAG